MSYLSNLIGLKVEKIELIHDYLQICYDDKSVLNIYSNYSFNNDDSNNLKGTELTNTIEKDNEVVLVFNDAIRLSVDLSDDGYNYPEAMTLFREAKPTVVWN